MSIEICDELEASGYIQFTIHEDVFEAFKEMVARGLNVWPDAPPALKEFHDNLLHGYPLQDYYAQSNVKGMYEISEAERFRLNNAPAKSKDMSDKPAKESE